jgi:hypothetical protein
MKWLNVLGLVLDIVGAIILTRGLIVSNHQAVELGRGSAAISRGGYEASGDPTPENLALPPVADRLRQSRSAKRGLAFLILGFLLQIIASWPR